VQGFHLRPRDVEAHPPARDLGDHARGRESRQEDQPGQLALVGGDRDPALPRLRADRVEVEPPAVVGHRHLDGRPPEFGRDRDPAAFRLARRPASGGRLDPVIHGVPHELEQGIPEAFQDRAVHLHLPALEHDLHVLGGGLREIAHRPLQPLEYLDEREHADGFRLLVDPADGHVERPLVGGEASAQPVDVLRQAAEALALGPPGGIARPGHASLRHPTADKPLEFVHLGPAQFERPGRHQEFAALPHERIELARRHPHPVGRPLRHRRRRRRRRRCLPRRAGRRRRGGRRRRD
jgi:hypothetical protein